MFKLITQHLYIILTIFFTVYSQLVMKWRVDLAGDLPQTLEQKVGFVLNLILSPWVVTALLATFLAGVSWMLAMTKFELSYAFPFVSLNYVFIMIASSLLFFESVSPLKIIGTLIIMLGLVLVAKG